MIIDNYYILINKLTSFLSTFTQLKFKIYSNYVFNLFVISFIDKSKHSILFKNGLTFMSEMVKYEDSKHLS